VSASGNGIYCRNTNRRRAASSIAQGKFVAASTKTRGLSVVDRAAAAEARLLHWMRNSVFRRREASFSFSLADREVKRESISSTNMTLGERALASVKSARTSFSDSPSYMSALDVIHGRMWVWGPVRIWRPGLKRRRRRRLISLALRQLLLASSIVRGIGMVEYFSCPRGPE